MSLEDSELHPGADEGLNSAEPENETVAYGETDDWGSNDLEAAYRKALEANDAVEWEFDHLAPVANVDNTATDTDSDSEEVAIASDQPAAAVTGDADSGATTQSEGRVEPLPQRVTARQVIEAAIFVGGEPLTAKKLCYMLKGDYDLDAVERSIEELNLQYVDEARPCEIRLGEGGYRLVLREEFERIRNRVFGIGPREVRLSQDVLEVLALVAYRQPITPEEIEELGKENPGPLLRQLLRRELISLERDSEDRKRVTYSTTKRFLSLFGLGSIHDLPQADELAFK
ncbi:MAG: SMC-Scp complex subunit ScpB [Rhodopirellula sp.]|nr:SMC-Scp complex subunit ScpB [Rhodopirellula sp.]